MPSSQIEIAEYFSLNDLIKQGVTFCLTTHINPDGDAIGSTMAMYYALRQLNKKIRIINVGQTPHFLTFLDPHNVIEKYNSNDHIEYISAVDVLIALDLNRVDRLFRMGEIFKSSKGVKICIDHHQDTEPIFDHILVDTDAVATAQIIYNFIKITGIVPMNYEIALNLYAAIMTDSGSFRFERTTPEVHKIAAEMLNYGVNPMEVFRNIYDQNHSGRIQLLGEVLQSIQLLGTKKDLAVIDVPYHRLKETGTREDDTDGFIHHPMSIASVKIALKFLELEHGFKVSLRSKGNISVHKLAALFGGGGHKNAAGIRIRDKKLEDMRQIIIDAAIDFLKESPH